jgi:hypothetical protein
MSCKDSSVGVREIECELLYFINGGHIGTLADADFGARIAESAWLPPALSHALNCPSLAMFPLQANASPDWQFCARSLCSIGETFGMRGFLTSGPRRRRRRGGACSRQTETISSEFPCQTSAQVVCRAHKLSATRTSRLPRAQVVCQPHRMPGRAHRSSDARTDRLDARTDSQDCRTASGMSAQVAGRAHSALEHAHKSSATHTGSRTGAQVV